MIDIPGHEAYVKFKTNSAITAKGFSMIMETHFDEGDYMNLVFYYFKFHRKFIE